MQKTPLAQSEAAIQQQIVRWYRNTYCLKHHSPRCMIFSIPNEGRGAASIQLIATGLYPGCADLCVIHDDLYFPKILFFECKTEEGVQSEKQKAFQGHCNQMGVEYYVVRSLESFKAIIKLL